MDILDGSDVTVTEPNRHSDSLVTVRRCKLCGKKFDVSPNPAQSGKKYCTRKHKFMAHQKRRKIAKRRAREEAKMLAMQSAGG